MSPISHPEIPELRRPLDRPQEPHLCLVGLPLLGSWAQTAYLCMLGWTQGTDVQEPGASGCVAWLGWWLGWMLGLGTVGVAGACFACPVLSGRVSGSLASPGVLYTSKYTPQL